MAKDQNNNPSREGSEPRVRNVVDPAELRKIIAQQRAQAAKAREQAAENDADANSPTGDEAPTDTATAAETPAAAQGACPPETVANEPLLPETADIRDRIRQIVDRQRKELAGIGQAAISQPANSGDANSGDANSGEAASGDAAAAESTQAPARPNVPYEPESQSEEYNAPDAAETGQAEADDSLRQAIAQRRSQLMAERERELQEQASQGEAREGNDAAGPPSGQPPVVAAAGARPAGRNLLVLGLIAVNTIVMVVVIYLLFRMPETPRQVGASMTPTVGAISHDAKASESAGSSDPAADVAETLKNEGPDFGGESWFRAEEEYAAGRFRKALKRYEKIFEHVRTRSDDQLVRDLVAWRVAACLAATNQGDQAREILTELCESQSPAIRAVAYRDLCVLDASEGGFLSARRRAYASIGACGAAEELAGVEDDCDFLIARAITAEVLDYSGESLEGSWATLKRSDPFAGKKPQDIEKLLEQGRDLLHNAVATPTLHRLSAPGKGGQWVACWSGPLLEDLLNRLAVHGDMDVRWDSQDTEMRRRVISLTFSQGISEQKLAEVACGATGLLARFTGREVVVHNPRGLQSLRTKRDLLELEATSLWRRFFLRKTEDNRVAAGHYALARLYESTRRQAEAIREYHLVSTRFWRSEYGAPSLIRLAGLRSRLRDYAGARQDLLDLLDKYPDTEKLDEVYISLGENALGAGMSEEAILTYQRLYHMNLSSSSRMKACLAAGRCLFKLERYSEATQWLNRAIGLAGEANEVGLAEVYMLLGRAASEQGKADEAALALGRVLTLEPSNDLRIEVLLQLVPVQIQRKQFVRAVGVLDTLAEQELEPEQFARYLVLTGRTYRAMGLAEKGVMLLRNQLPLLTDEDVRVSAQIELARCLSRMGRTTEARDILTSILSRATPGPEVQTAQLELALMLLEADRVEQAASTLRDLTRPSVPEHIRREAARALGSAYVRMGQYESAAAVLSGQIAAKTGNAHE